MTALLAPAALPAALPQPVRLRPAPRREPPFDDEVPAGGSAAPGTLATRLPFTEPRPHRPPAPTRPGVLPDPAAWGRRLLIGITESAAGRRPLAQLVALLTPSVAQGIGRHVEHRAAPGGRHWLAAARVRSVRAAQPADEIAEVSATLQSGPRVHAVALRLEVRHGRWCCTRLELG
jgi:hypothetical protein